MVAKKGFLMKRIRTSYFVMIIFLTMAAWPATANSGDVIEDFKSNVMYPNIACEGKTIGVFVDLDGKNNGTPHDPAETMVTFYTANGQAYGESVGGNKRYVFTPHTNGSCGNAHCAGHCDRGRIAIGFVDMTGTGFDAKNPSTWTYKGMDEVSFDMWNDRTVTTNNAMSYQQAKAYKVQSAPNPPDRSDRID